MGFENTLFSSKDLYSFAMASFHSLAFGPFIASWNKGASLETASGFSLVLMSILLGTLAICTVNRWITGPQSV